MMLMTIVGMIQPSAASIKAQRAEEDLDPVVEFGCETVPNIGVFNHSKRAKCRVDFAVGTNLNSLLRKQWRLH